MPTFKVKHTQRVLSIYIVTAEDEDQAEGKVMDGKFDSCELEDDVVDGECDTEVVKIRCNNCMHHFSDDAELKRFEDQDGALDGCPDCETDEYLMDLE